MSLYLNIITDTENSEMWLMVISQSWSWTPQLYIQIVTWYINYNDFETKFINHYLNNGDALCNTVTCNYVQ